MKRLLAIFTTAILITFALLFLKIEYSHNLRVKNSGIDFALSSGEIDCLFLGSSCFRQGLNVKALESFLGDKVCILAYNGNQPNLMREELNFLLKKGVKIKRVFFELNPNTLSDPKLSDTRILLDVDSHHKFEIFNAINAVNPYSWNEKYTFFVLSNNEYIFTFPVSSRLLASRYYKGGLISADDGIRGEHGLVFRHVPEFEEFAKVNPIQVNRLLEMIATLEEKGIEFSFIEMPKFKKLSSNVSYVASRNEIADILKKAGAKVVLFENSEFLSDESNFRDFSHLSTQGQLKFTEILKKQLQERAL